MKQAASFRAKMAGLNNTINENANRIANKLIADGTKINDRTIHFFEDNLPGLPDLPTGGAKDACIARSVLIAVAEQTKKKSKTTQ